MTVQVVPSVEDSHLRVAMVALLASVGVSVTDAPWHISSSSSVSSGFSDSVTLPVPVPLHSALLHSAMVE